MEATLDGRSVVWMHVGDRRLADAIVRAATQDPLDGGALVADHAVVPEHHDTVRRISDE